MTASTLHDRERDEPVDIRAPIFRGPWPDLTGNLSLRQTGISGGTCTRIFWTGSA